MNAIILSACTLLMRTVAVAFNAFCVNKVGSEGMGLFSLVMSVYTFAVTVATSGVNLASTRLTALYYGKNQGKSVKSAMRKCFLYSFAFGTAASILLYIFSDFAAKHFLCEARAGTSLRALSLSLLPLSLCSAISGYFSAVRRVYKNAVSQVLEQTVKILSCTFLLAALLPRGIEFACLALVLGGTLSELFSFILQALSYFLDAKNLVGDGEKVSFGTVAKISLPVALSAYVRSGLVTLEHVLIPIGLSAFGDEAALATYGTVSAVALPIVLYPSAFVGAFSGQIIPEITEFDAAKNKKEVAYIASRAFFVTEFFSFLAAGMFSVFSFDLCYVIYGSHDAAEYLRALAPLVPIMFLDTVTDSILKGLGKQFYTMCVNIADAAVSVLLVWLLVPRMGIYGYVAVLYVSECVNTVFSIGKLLSLTDLKISLKKTVFLPLLSTVGSANILFLAFSFFLPEINAFTLIFKCICYVTLYFATSFLFGTLTKEEINWIKGVVKR